MSKELLFRLSKKDFELEFFRGSGKGGQNRNKVETGVRIRHLASGAVAEDCTERSREQNKKKAFRKLVNTPEFKLWHKIECARRLGQAVDVDTWVAEQMRPENLKIEVVSEYKKVHTGKGKEKVINKL